MKLLDLSKCHEDSLGFRRNLEAFEEATVQLEKTLKRICSICEKRAELAQRDSELTNDLVAEMEFFTHNDLAGENETSVGNPMEMLTTSLRQLADNQERLFEQIDLALVKPMKHFLHNDIEQVKASRKTYRKLHAEAVHLEEKICQCKRYEAGLMNELSYQLFDTRFQLHRAACEYVLDLNALHSKKTPDFLQRVVDLMTSYFSYHHIGSVTTKESHPVVEGLYQTLENLRKQCTAEDTQRRTQVQTLLQEVFLSRTEDLLVFHQNDLQVPSEVAKGNVRQHLAANYSDVSYAPREVAFPDVQSSQSRSKSGYLMYLEQKTFGNAWIRLFFTAKRGKLEAPENKAKIPIGLNLKLCQVKPGLPSDSERNFCFKVISPTRQLLLQAQSSKDMQEWIEVLTNAITHSLHHQRPSLSLEEQELLSPTDDLASSPTSISDSPTLPPFPDLKKDKPKTGSAILRELQSIPGNELCADCFMEKPKWASVNLGVLICIDCSGVHRSLGVHISQVRSLTLDTVKPEWEERLRMIGNNRANEIYEEMLPEEFSREPIQKDESRSQFIMNKYKEMKYCSEANRLKIKEEREQSRTKSLQKAALASLQSPPPAPAPVTVVTTMGNGRERRIETEVEHTQGIVLASGSVNLKHKKPSHPPQRPDSPSGSLVMSASGSGMLQKMTKSLGTMKETVVKFAKNDL